MGIQLNGTSGTDVISAVDGSLTVEGLTISGDFNIADKIVHSGDTNTAIRFPAADTVTVETAGSERLRIKSDGDVNIGPAANANGHGLLTLSQSASAAFNALVIQQGNTAFTATDGLQIGIDAGVHAYIKQYENRDIYFTTGNPNTEKLRIKSNGQVAIGTDTAETGYIVSMHGDLSLGEKSGTDNTYLDQKQDGDFHIINSGRTANGASATSAGGVGINRYNNIAGGTSLFRDFTVYNGKNSKVLVVDGSASSVGIGEDAPDRKLHIKNAGQIKLESTDTGNWLGLQFLGSSGTNDYDGYMGILDSNGNFFIDNNSNGDDFVITQAGQLRFPQNGAEVCWGASQQFRISWDNGEERAYLTGVGAYGLAFRVNGGNRLEINKTTGDVTMQGASGRNFTWDNSAAELILSDNGSGASARLKIGSSGDLQMYHDVSGPNHITCSTNQDLKVSIKDLQLYDYSGVSHKMTVDSNGNIKLGTAGSYRAGERILIQKSVGYNNGVVAITQNDSTVTERRFIYFFNDQGGVAGSVRHTGATSCQYHTSSDYRLKENVVDITDGISRIKQLKPKRFNFKTEPGETVDGFLAHEVSPVIPDAVSGDKDGEVMQSLGYERLTPLLTAALKEAIAKIETLEAEVAALKSS